MTKPISRIVVVGAGQSGGRLASELRDRGFSGKITIVGDEGLLPYERPPLSKAVLAGEARPEDAPVNPAEYYREHGIELILGDPARWVDRESRNVLLESGERVAYDRLVLATGARPRRLDAIGASLPEVHSLRTAADADAIGGALRAAKAVVIVGGGFVGLEVASLAATRGLEVVVVEHGVRCMARVVPALAAARITARHHERGVAIRYRASVVAIEGRERVERVVLSDGARIAADLVVVGIGSRPEASLAEAAGIECGGGVLVDAGGRTSDPHVYAIGDVARRAGVRRESWQNAEQSAAEAAAAILDLAPPAAQPPWFWTDQHDLNVQLIGTFAEDDDVREIGPSAKGGVLHLHSRHGVVTGAVMFNAGSERRKLARMIDTAAPIDSVQKLG